jgi:hypothetical protein
MSVPISQLQVIIGESVGINEPLHGELIVGALGGFASVVNVTDTIGLIFSEISVEVIAKVWLQSESVDVIIE